MIWENVYQEKSSTVNTEQDQKYRWQLLSVKDKTKTKIKPSEQFIFCPIMAELQIYRKSVTNKYITFILKKILVRKPVKVC